MRRLKTLILAAVMAAMMIIPTQAACANCGQLLDWSEAETSWRTDVRGDSQ